MSNPNVPMTPRTPGNMPMHQFGIRVNTIKAVELVNLLWNFLTFKSVITSGPVETSYDCSIFVEGLLGRPRQ